MGVYWKWVCPERGEHLRVLDHESDKDPRGAADTLRRLVELCQFGPWAGELVKLIHDGGREQDTFYSGPRGLGWRDPPAR